MTATGLHITFEPVTGSDLPLLERWLEASHVRAWWGDPATELGYIRDMIEGRDTTRPYVFSVGGQPSGYIQAWFIGHYQETSWADDYPWLALLPADAVGVDLFIGRAGLLARGIGPAAIIEFVAGLRRQGHRTIIIDPDPDNRRAVRAYQKAGFRIMPELVGRTDDSLLMRHDPGAEPRAA
jgi:aminoglycoside 6'-N-acetyltransferase